MNIEDICETGPTVYSPYPRYRFSLKYLLEELQVVGIL